METTIQISHNLRNALKIRKLHDKEKYEDVIWDLIEDSKEISEQTLKNIAESEKQIKEGKVVSFDKIKKDFGLNV